jgi:hypothetical protein
LRTSGFSEIASAVSGITTDSQERLEMIAGLSGGPCSREIIRAQASVSETAKLVPRREIILR